MSGYNNIGGNLPTTGADVTPYVIGGLVVIGLAVALRIVAWRRSSG